MPLTWPGWTRWPWMRSALIWAGIAALLLLINWGKIATRQFPDPDDTMRLVQVRDLLNGQGWFDLHQYRLDPPGGALMHWSRLVDLPLALLILVLTPVVGTAAAETATMVAVPLITLGVILFAVERIARRFLDGEGVIFACLAAGLAPLLAAQVQPMRIDHHGWQIAAVLLAMTGLLPDRPIRGAALSGLMMAIGMSISIELLPIAAGFAAAFALPLFTPQRDLRPLAIYLASLAASLLVTFALTRGLADLASHCDSVSPAHLAFFAVVAIAAGVLARADGPSREMKLGGLAIAGIAGLAVFLSLAPDCAAGPFGALDPLVHKYWYNSIPEGRPTWYAPASLALPAIAQAMAAVMALLHLWRRSEGAEKRWWLAYLVVMAATLATGLVLWRAMAFVGALGAVPLGWLAASLMARLRSSQRPLVKLAAAGALTLILVPSFPGALISDLAPATAAASPVGKNMASEACGLPATAQRLAALPRGVIFAPLDVGPAILVDTPHAVVASSHHRAQAAMHDVITAFLGSADEAHALVRQHHATYLLSCPDLIETQLYAGAAPGGFADQLNRGKAPAWLEPTTHGPPTGPAIYRVR